MKLRTSRREASESKYFLELLYCPGDLTQERDRQCQEAQELGNILSAMIVKTERKRVEDEKRQKAKDKTK